MSISQQPRAGTTSPPEPSPTDASPALPGYLLTACIVAALVPSSRRWLAGAWAPRSPNALTRDSHVLSAGPDGLTTAPTPGMARIVDGPPQLAHPALPTTTSAFWLSFFFGIIGFWIAHDTTKRALAAGYATTAYWGSAIRGFLWSIGSYIALCLLWFLVVLIYALVARGY